MNIKDLLCEEIESEFEGLKSMDLGSEKHKATVDGLTKLVDRAIEIKKVEIENDEKVTSREIDNDFKSQQMEDERKDRLVRNGITIASIVIPTAVTIWGTLKSFKFEETGTVTTTIGRGFINKLIPKK